MEFLIIGVTFGLAEDLLAIAIVSDAKIDLRVIGMVLLVAIPFAMLSELVVDHPRFWEKIKLRHPEDLFGGKK